jgi:hypothetical protein
MENEALVERLHQFFVKVFTTYDLFDKDKRQEMRLESLALDDDVAKVEKELADYKKHFEPQMIQIRLLEKAHSEQALTFRRG